MISHNFVRGNHSENAKLQKTLRLKDEIHNQVEQKHSISPFSRNQNSTSFYQPSQSTIESKSQIFLDSNQTKYLSTDRKSLQKQSLHTNNYSNLSFFMSEGHQNSAEQSLFQNTQIQKQVENTKSVEQLSQRRCYTPNQIRSVKQYDDCLQNSNFQQNNTSNMQQENNLNVYGNKNLEFMYQIKSRRISRRHYDTQNHQKIDSKKQDQLLALQEDKKTINHQLEQTNMKNSSLLTQNQINEQDIQYLLQNNYKIIPKKQFQEISELQSQQNNLSDMKRKFFNSRCEWKQRLITDINEQISQTETIQNENINKINKNKLNPLNIKCQTEGPSKRNSKEEEQSKELLFQQQYSNQKVINMLNCMENASTSKQEDKPSLFEVIKNCGKEIVPHPRNLPTNIFSDQINYFDLLKKLSNNCKKTEYRSISTNPKSKQDANIFIQESPLKQKSSPKKLNNINNQNPICFQKDGQVSTDNKCDNLNQQIHDKSIDLLNVTLKPQQMQINKGIFNSTKFYGRLSSVKRNQSKENTKKYQEVSLLQKKNQIQIQDSLYLQQQQLNKSVNYFENRKIFNQDIKHQNFVHDQQNHLQNHSKLDSNIQKLSVLSSLNSLDLEPVQQFSQDFLQSFIEKQNKINTFYTRYNQKKFKESPVKSVKQNQHMQQAETQIKINSISPQKNQFSPVKNKSFVHDNSKKETNPHILSPLILPSQKKMETNRYNQIHSKMAYCKKESDLMPWDYSQRDSHLNDIDLYLNLMENTSLIQG